MILDLREFDHLRGTIAGEEIVQVVDPLAGEVTVPCRIELDYRQTSGTFHFHGRVDGTFSSECHRCLDPVKVSIGGDFDLMVRLFLRRKIRSAYIPEILVRMRTGGKTNQSVRNIIRGNLESLDSLRSHGVAVTPMFFVGKLLSRLPQFFRRPGSTNT